MPRRLAAVCCLGAGLLVLAGPGWALLGLGGLLLFGLPSTSDATLAAGASRARAVAGELGGRVRALPRRAMAVGGMATGVLAVPVGLLVAVGAGAAVVAFGVLMLGVSLLSGWNA